MATSLDIVIVNWNAGTQLQRCLDSIRVEGHEGFELLRVVVVDNASSDGSAEQLQERELPLSILRNETNRGFAAACNQGAQSSGASYLLFLNPDCTLFPDSLNEPFCYMEQPEHARVGIVGIQLLNAEGTVSRSCARFPSFHHMISAALGLASLSELLPDHQMTNWDHLETREVDHVIGAFMLMRRTVFEELGGYDERFFVYLEDLDLSLRMNKLGFTSIYLATARAFHEGGGCSTRAKASRLFYSLRSRIMYCYKHFSWWYAAAITLAIVLIEPLLRLVYAAWRDGVRGIADTMKAYAMLWSWLAGSLFRQNRVAPARLNSNTFQGELSASRKREWDGSSVSDAAAKAGIHSGDNN